MRPSMVSGWAVKISGSTTNRVSSTTSVILVRSEARTTGGAGRCTACGEVSGWKAWSGRGRRPGGGSSSEDEPSGSTNCRRCTAPVEDEDEESPDKSILRMAPKDEAMPRRLGHGGRQARTSTGTNGPQPGSRSRSRIESGSELWAGVTRGMPHTATLALRLAASRCTPAPTPKSGSGQGLKAKGAKMSSPSSPETSLNGPKGKKRKLKRRVARKRRKLTKNNLRGGEVRGARGETKTRPGNRGPTSPSPKRPPSDKKVRDAPEPPPKVRQEPDKFGFYCTPLASERSAGPSPPPRHDQRSVSMDRRRNVGGDRGFSPQSGSRARNRSRSPRLGSHRRVNSRSPLLDHSRRGGSYEEGRMRATAAQPEFSPPRRSRDDGAQSFTRDSSAPRHYRNMSPNLRRDTSRTALPSRDRSPSAGRAQGIKRAARSGRSLKDPPTNQLGRLSPERDFRDGDRGGHLATAESRRGAFDDRDMRGDPDALLGRERDLRRDINVKSDRRFDGTRSDSQGRGFGRTTRDEPWTEDRGGFRDQRSGAASREERRPSENRVPAAGAGRSGRDSWGREETREWSEAEGSAWRERPGARGGGRRQASGGASGGRLGERANRGMAGRSNERGRGEKTGAQLTGANSVRVQPRGRDDWSARRRSPVQEQRGLARDRRSHSNERLLPPEALSRLSRERSPSRERGSNSIVPPPEEEGSFPTNDLRRSMSRELSKPREPRSRGGSLDTSEPKEGPREGPSESPVSHKRPLEEEGGCAWEMNASLEGESKAITHLPTGEVAGESAPVSKKARVEDEGNLEGPKSPAPLETTSPTPALEGALILGSPKPLVDENAEDISDIGESDDEILNQEAVNEANEADLEKEEQALEAGELSNKEDEPSDKEENDGKSRDSWDVADSKAGSERLRPHSQQSHEDKMDNDLLEGISDEDLDLSDEDESRTKARIADALGADWSELIAKPEEKPSAANTTLRQKWSMLSIIKSVGLSKDILGEEKYRAYLQKLNQDLPEGEDPFEPLHDLAGVDVLLRKRAIEQMDLFSKLRPHGEGLTGTKDKAIRRHLLGYLPGPSVKVDAAKLRPCSETYEAAMKALQEKMVASQ
eukprot:maker-scaffold532_size145644-snap-gene-0.43 protein:Tk04530 transcript:maker-scaffold532_size145644-snap-gene-0.43-mRNA-1 annotation:"eukaryotic translation initiation factor 3 subunit a"